MMLPLVVFGFVVALVMGTYAAITYLPGILATREMDRRLRDVSSPVVDDRPKDSASIVRQERRGPIPTLDRLLENTTPGIKLKRLIERSGVGTTPSGMVLSLIHI